jgi:hypothetical protein
MRGQPQDARRPRQGLARWLQPWRESEVVASALDLARESFVEPWSELGQEFVEATRPLTRRGLGAAAGAAGGGRGSQQQQQQQVGDTSGSGAQAATFPAPPHDAAQADQGAVEQYEEVVVQRRPTVSRPLIPGSPPEVPSYRSQAPARSSWTAHLVQGGAAAAEVQRHVEAQAAFQAAQQRSGAGSASLGLYTPHMPQKAARTPLPPGTAVLVGPPEPIHDIQRVAQPHERPDSDTHSSGSQLAAHLDTMFDAIHASHDGGATSSDADAWAAMRMAEQQRAQAAAAARGGGDGARGPSTSMQPPSSRGHAAQLGEHVSGERLRAVNAAAEAARQRLAALRVAHPDSFPAASARALYTPWTDVHAAEVDKGQDWGDGDAEEVEVETHATARLLGQRWRVILAAVVVALTLVLYARDVLTGADGGVPHKLLMWRAGEAAGYEPPPPAPNTPPGVAGDPPGPPHQGLHLVVADAAGDASLER